MNIYNKKDSDIVYNIDIDYSVQVINYPIYLSQYSSDIYIKVNLFDNGNEIKVNSFSSIVMHWYNYSIKRTFILQPDYISSDEKSVYFKITGEKTTLYNVWASSYIKVILTKNNKSSTRELELMVERNPIQK